MWQPKMSAIAKYPLGSRIAPTWDSLVWLSFMHVCKKIWQLLCNKIWEDMLPVMSIICATQWTRRTSGRGGTELRASLHHSTSAESRYWVTPFWMVRLEQYSPAFGASRKSGHGAWVKDYVNLPSPMVLICFLSLTTKKSWQPSWSAKIM